jgi:ketosteroid isomerase-like protein
MSQQDLEAGFKAWQDALNRGDMENFFAAMDDDIVIYDEDIPWRFSKANMIDHLSFHAKVWDAFQWVPRELRFQTRGDTGLFQASPPFAASPRMPASASASWALPRLGCARARAGRCCPGIRGHSTASSTGPRQADAIVHAPMHSYTRYSTVFATACPSPTAVENLWRSASESSLVLGGRRVLNFGTGVRPSQSVKGEGRENQDH